MKTNLSLLLAGVFVSSVFGISSLAAPFGTAFTYQGKLADAGGAANGHYDITFKLFNASSGPSQVGSTISSNNLAASNGLFVATLDFGAAVFDGTAYWLELAVRPSSVGSFLNLVPRQPLTPSPYALYAANAGTSLGVAANSIGSGSLQNASITAVKIAAGQVVKSFNGLHDDVTLAAGLNLTLTPSGNLLTLDSPTWSLTGNSGTTAAHYLGTADAKPLELRVNASRALRLEFFGRTSGGPLFFTQRGVNVLGGYWGNSIGANVIGATIAGGGDETGLVFSPNPFPNGVTNDFGSIGGGYNNWAGYAGAVPGGYNNSAGGIGSFAAGRDAHVTHGGSFLWCDGSQRAFSTGDNRFEVLAQGGLNFFNGINGVNVDMFNGNTGTTDYSLRFGVGSGEAIGSKRNGGGNQYGLDFYTAFAKRMSIANYGFVGIGIDTPQQALDVNGNFILVRGGGNEQAYLGGDGFGSDVQIGSLNSSVQNVAMYNASSGAYMNLYVRALTVVGGADLAEPFAMSQEDIAAGAVVVIDPKHPGRLMLSTESYDRKVAGVVSGAGNIAPGISMIQKDKLEAGKNVALTGRVYVQADAAAGPIEPGDLLTTSDRPGRAMKAADPGRAQGAILGKAMTALADGEGLVLVLVTLQ